MKLTVGNKHKGKEISDVVHEDYDYCIWLCTQDWFITKFSKQHEEMEKEMVKYENKGLAGREAEQGEWTGGW